MQRLNSYELSKATALSIGMWMVWYMNKELIFTVGRDKTIPVYSFQNPFIVILPDMVNGKTCFNILLKGDSPSVKLSPKKSKLWTRDRFGHW
jgi:hypothetical protein